MVSFTKRVECEAEGVADKGDEISESRGAQWRIKGEIKTTSPTFQHLSRVIPNGMIGRDAAVLRGGGAPAQTHRSGRTTCRVEANGSSGSEYPHYLWNHQPCRPRYHPRCYPRCAIRLRYGTSALLVQLQTPNLAQYAVAVARFVLGFIVRVAYRHVHDTTAEGDVRGRLITVDYPQTAAARWQCHRGAAYIHRPSNYPTSCYQH
ncbi:hypothetical protein J6590_022546 [Homalodisca vitripennis]|nr:hypothetical protein J6590_022546 [Homalodisca vitripennis]